MTDPNIDKTKQSVELPFRVEMALNRLYGLVIDAQRAESANSFLVQSLSNEDFIYMIVTGNRKLPSHQFGVVISARLKRYFLSLNLTEVEVEQAVNEVIRREIARVSEG